MSRRLAIALVATLGILALAAPARGQGTGPCTHQGRPVQCPAGLPPGSQSVSFVPGGTNWRNSATGAVVFVPSTTFPPFVAAPTSPPGPTTQPGPGQPPGGPVLGFPFTAEGQIYLTQPSDREATKPLLDPATARQILARTELEEAKAAKTEALKAYYRVIDGMGLAAGLVDPDGIATKNRMIDYRGEAPAVRVVIIQVTPQLRATSARFYEVLNKEEALHKERVARGDPYKPYSNAFTQAVSDFKAAAAAAPVDQAATERAQRAQDAYDRAEEAERRAQDELDEGTDKPLSLDRVLREDPVEQSDVDEAPTFEPFKDQGAVDDVM
jgi:hypothetical protein